MKCMTRQTENYSIIYSLISCINIIWARNIVNYPDHFIQLNTLSVMIAPKNKYSYSKEAAQRTISIIHQEI